MHYPSTIKSCCRWRKLESILSIPISFSLQLGMLLLGRLLCQHQQLKFTVIVQCSVACQICQHSLAGAEYMGLQSEHFVWVTKTKATAFNRSNLMSHEITKPVGRKGSTSRRKGGPKGGRNQKKMPLCVETHPLQPH